MVEKQTEKKTFLGRKVVEYVPVVKAKEDLKEFNDSLAEGEEWMKANRQPFCSACMVREFEKRKELNNFERVRVGGSPRSIEVPDWHDYAGNGKFRLLNKVERRNRKQMSVETEENYECLANSTHHVTMMDQHELQDQVLIDKSLKGKN